MGNIKHLIHRLLRDQTLLPMEAEAEAENLFLV